MRNSGEEAEDESGDDKDDGIRDLNLASERGEDYDKEKQEKEDEFDGVNAVT